MRFVILGSGPAGYAAASTAAALGAEVTIVDRMALGGNWTMTDGIPSKTLLQVASSMAEIDRAESRGVVFEHGRPRVDLLRAEAHARFIGQHQSRGVRERLDLIEATIIYGQGAIESDGVLVATTERGPQRIEYDHLLVCTGAAPVGAAVRPGRPPARAQHARRARPARPARAAARGRRRRDGLRVRRVLPELRLARHAALVAPADPAHRGSRRRRRRARGVPRARHGDRARTRAPPTSSATARACARPPRTAAHFTGTHAIICMGMRAHTDELGLESVGVEVGPRGEIVHQRLLPHLERAHLGRRRRHRRLDAGLDGRHAGPHLGALGARPRRSTR